MDQQQPQKQDQQENFLQINDDEISFNNILYDKNQKDQFEIQNCTNIKQCHDIQDDLFEFNQQEGIFDTQIFISKYQQELQKAQLQEFNEVIFNQVSNKNKNKLELNKKIRKTRKSKKKKEIQISQQQNQNQYQNKEESSVIDLVKQDLEIIKNTLQVKKKKKLTSFFKPVFIVNPERIVFFQKNFVNKNYTYMNEDITNNQIYDDKQLIVKHDDDDFCATALVNHYHYFDYLVHNNKDKFKPNDPEFVCVFLKMYKFNQMPGQYMAERFRSFTNSIFKQQADIIERSENQYLQFLNSPRGQMIQRLNEQYLLNKKQFIEETCNDIKKILNDANNKPVKIFMYRLGTNDMLQSVICQIYNDELLKLLEYTPENFSNYTTKTLKLPNYYFIKSPREVFQTKQKYFKNLLLRQELEEPLFYPLNSVYLKSQFGKPIKNIQIEVKLYFNGINSYSAYIVHNVDQID